MSFRLADKWVWDFWFIQDRGERHMFYLQAPRSLGDPSLRHHHATIGHAVSDDYRNWTVLADAVHPGPAGTWDDLATWTGSGIGHEGQWYMLYTGVGRADQGLVQRIGLAFSDDLVNWHKYRGNPVIEADPRWYEVLGQGRWRDQSWRDPWLFFCAEDGRFHVLLTARSPSAAPDASGVVGHARSRDLLEWEVLPPVTEPGEFAQVEVPQLVQAENDYLILFSCHSEDHSRTRVERLGPPARGGTFAMRAESLKGPWVPSGSPIATSADGKPGNPYAGKMVKDNGGNWLFIAFHGDDDQSFSGELVGPYPVEWAPDGTFVVEVSRGGGDASITSQ
ncbi:MAG TPA: hypothetical protein VME46_14145 [Acidimicrobiales bacterium]|nr:hypothetical protein [Acidimicrobiales bacterium]